MILDFFGMFDFTEGDGDTYQYTSEEFSAFIAAIIGNGVSKNAYDMFTTTRSGLTLTVGAGGAFINGRYGANEEAKTINLDAESVSLERYDRLVVEANVSTRAMNLTVVKGTAAGTAVKPALTQTALLWQIPLYAIKITNGSTTTLEDERTYTYSAAEISTELATINSALSTINTTVAGKANTSHTQAISTITGLQSALDSMTTLINGKAASAHTHAISDTAGLQTALDGKAASSHTHSIANVTNLQTSLDGKSDTSHNHSGTYAPASHNHSAGEITSGALAIANGGTGATTAAAALLALGIIYQSATPTYAAGKIWLKPI